MCVCVCRRCLRRVTKKIVFPVGRVVRWGREGGNVLGSTAGTPQHAISWGNLRITRTAVTGVAGHTLSTGGGGGCCDPVIRRPYTKNPTVFTTAAHTRALETTWPVAACAYCTTRIQCIPVTRSIVSASPRTYFFFFFFFFFLLFFLPRPRSPFLLYARRGNGPSPPALQCFVVYRSLRRCCTPYGWYYTRTRYYYYYLSTGTVISGRK